MFRNTCNVTTYMRSFVCHILRNICTHIKCDMTYFAIHFAYANICNISRHMCTHIRGDMTYFAIYFAYASECNIYFPYVQHIRQIYAFFPRDIRPKLHRRLSYHIRCEEVRLSHSRHYLIFKFTILITVLRMLSFLFQLTLLAEERGRAKVARGGRGGGVVRVTRSLTEMAERPVC